MNGIQIHNNWKYIGIYLYVRINHKKNLYSLIDILIHHNNENTAESNSVV